MNQANPAKRKNENRQWHALELEKLLKTLETSTDQGLSSHAAERRLRSAGPNQLEEAKPVTLWQMIWEQLNSFVVYLLIIASAISAVLGDYLEAGVILAIVVLNTILGAVQERRAEQALSALKKMAAPEAHVIRDGYRRTVPANQLVPGDLVLLETGYYVPADLRLFETINLRINESALTGESLSAQKDSSVRLQQDVPLGDRKNSAFMNSLG